MNNNNEELYLKKLSMRSMKLQYMIAIVMKELKKRSKSHDNSKRSGLEKTVFSENVRTYPVVWKSMNTKSHPLTDVMHAALMSHASNNDYMPDHFQHGVSEMNTVQLTEMCCDIAVSANELGMGYNETETYLRHDFSELYSIKGDILDIVVNTVIHLMKIGDR